ncbi:MAG: ion transporter [Bacteroidales bacterium]|nr:ion transporter [Lentimicrobiaceae bacterium]MDD5694647.1 ion transporter [Bacteroidales bacterium]
MKIISRIRQYLHANKIKILRQRLKLRRIIFESDTPAGKRFDITLLITILFSVLLVMLDSIPAVKASIGSFVKVIEWIVTGLFTLEYLLRVWTIGRPIKYITSFYGIIDLVSVLPTYLSLLISGSQYLIIIRIIRMLRIFRILKLGRFLAASNVLVIAMKESRHKIVVFLEVILTIVVIVGAFMYLIEGPENGFTSIPVSIYWAIVTITTVGYGDISPATPIGQMIASVIMILGYAIIAVPTGIITMEMSKAQQIYKKKSDTQLFCWSCGEYTHDQEANFCKKCGAKLAKKKAKPSKNK